MVYSKFSLQKVQQEFGLVVHEAIHFLPQLSVVLPDTLLTATLADGLPLALTQSNEKARNEWIINPILTAVRRLANTKVSVFSGKEFNVDSGRDLVGYYSGHEIQVRNFSLNTGFMGICTKNHACLIAGVICGFFDCAFPQIIGFRITRGDDGGGKT